MTSNLTGARRATTSASTDPKHCRRLGRSRDQLPAQAAATGPALYDEHWRVREMAAKVVAKRKIGDALHEVATLRQDLVARGRTAAERAIVVLTAAGS